MPDFDKKAVVEHLSHQFRLGTPVLFTGAGFSKDACDRLGNSLPLGGQLAEELWGKLDQELPYDQSDALQDVYQLALTKKQKEVVRFLSERLSVDPDTLPDFYRVYFDLPWKHVYTLNIDDLPLAASMRFGLERRISPISATSGTSASASGRPTPTLDVVYLNGTLSDLPDGVTFSRNQYADRIGAADPWYMRLAADLLCHPIVFLGTNLDEPPLWQHIRMRQTKGGRGMHELRPKSYLVSPQLPAAKRQVLKSFNVHWLQLSTSEFAEQILDAVHSKIAGYIPQTPEVHGVPTDVPAVATISAVAPTAPSEYLSGQEPIWADLQTGRAISRNIDDALLEYSTGRLASTDRSSVLILLGTAGSGKSTSLMRLALALSGGGRVVGYLDREMDMSPSDVVRSFANQDEMKVLVLDDASRYGTALRPMAQKIVDTKPGVLLVLALRSSRLVKSHAIDQVERADVQQEDMPPLADEDVDELLDTLDRHNRLGRLKGMPLPDQRLAIKQQAGRQLLVGMIQATSGVRFEDKVVEEYNDLDDEERLVYGIVATATGNGFSLSRNELLVAVGEATNDVLNLTEHLVKRGILAHPSTSSHKVAARHQEIARVLIEHLTRENQFHIHVAAIAFAAASGCSDLDRRNSRPWRLVKRLINHRYLNRHLEIAEARFVYEHVEHLLKHDYHYWLQRGCLEVKFGDVSLARNFISQAYSMNSRDRLVVTENAHLQLRLASDHPRGPEAAQLVKDAFRALEAQIASHGRRDYYPYHVLGSQGLRWSRRGPLDQDRRRELLRRLQKHLEEARRYHPLRREIATLHADVTRELLDTHVEE